MQTTISHWFTLGLKRAFGKIASIDKKLKEADDIDEMLLLACERLNWAESADHIFLTKEADVETITAEVVSLQN
ncbi:hypothetical protein [Floridanema aerugineum]|uniref:Uncharacterized protein n=1 Tax=Floridaenema aerugineum BLCC-F46 TaxID=3153654 RepID=A0ABV4X283_9CYAN